MGSDPQAEGVELQQLNRELRAISTCNQTLMRAQDEPTLLGDICRIVCDEAGYRMAWVGYAEHDEAKTVRPVASAGFEEGYLASAQLTWSEATEWGRGPGGTAIRRGETVLVQDIASDPRMAPWREGAARRGYRSTVGLPLKAEDGTAFGVLLIYSSEANVVTPEELRLLEELAGDLAFGITVLRARVERKRAESVMRARLRLLEFAGSHSMDEVLTATLDELEALTGSTIGFYHFVEPDQKTLSLQNWSTNTLLNMCQAAGKGSHYAIDQAGVWVDCVRERRPVIHNDYASLAHKRGLPEGHAPVIREAVVPIFRGSQIKAIIGVGNKPTAYDEPDIGIVSQLGDLSWDIIERMRIEQGLRESEEKFSAAFNASPSLVAITRLADGQILEVNPAYTRMLGYSREESLGRTTSELSIWADQAARDTFLAELKSSGQVTDLETRLRRKDGTLVAVLDSARTIQIQGETYVLSVARDITERKKAEDALRVSEQKFRALAENSPDNIFRYDLGGRVIYANQQVLLTLEGLVHAIYGKTPLELSPEGLYAGGLAELQHYQATLQDVIRTGGMAEVEMHVPDASGGLRTHLVRFRAERDADGKIAGALAFGRDITEKTRLEEQLRQSQKMEAIGQLAGGVAHDFNNILTAIIGFGNLAKMKMKPDDPQQVLIDHILASSDRAAHLTHSLLAFSRKQVLLPKPVDLNAIVQNVGKLLSRLIGEDIELIPRLTGQGLIVMADEGQIEQVLMNLATNARDAMPGGGSLTIATEAKELGADFMSSHGYGKAGKYALMTVSDTGRGMDAKTRERIFEPFFTTKAPEKGTGLGLSMVYGIIKQHEGFINVYSEPGKGTTFRIYLPMVAKATTEARAEPEPLPRGGHERLLLAEDDPVIRNLIGDILREFGYQVLEAVDGMDALDKIIARPGAIDLMILDVVMPKMNGKEVYDAARRMGGQPKTLFISGYTADFISQKGIFEEGVQFLAKPVSPFELLKKIRLILDEKA
ncbi:hypothetical protein GETHLI_11980 [Geothrix limicola]|uniref:histidine kinase n=1 Tax=Geothrix limicola TaxID=2927978 RepID=A0ABQ5QE45_9BACT|nr:GAF domain-containing protein [Geothrix limicola]GLH72696.1 hypothetical protein GETHLI_11980 [Geothrix limicola]